MAFMEAMRVIIMVEEAKITIRLEDIPDLPSIQIDITEDLKYIVILLKIFQQSAITARNIVISWTIAVNSSK